VTVIEKIAVTNTVKANSDQRMSKHSINFASLDPEDDTCLVKTKDIGKDGLNGMLSMPFLV
jgi:hypothetical protein